MPSRKKYRKAKAHPHEPRLIAGLIAALVIAAMVQGPLQQAQLVSSFPDVAPNSLEMLATESLKNLGVMQGFPDGTFKGVLVLNRAQAAKIMLLASNKKVIQSRNAGFFKDMPDMDWYVPFVITAALKGIVSGYPDGTFQPARNVNTAEFLKMMNLAFDMPTYIPHSYPDVPPTDWYAKYAGAADQYDLFPNRQGFLGPNLPITRSEAAIAIYQYIKFLNPEIPSSSSSSSSSSEDLVISIDASSSSEPSSSSEQSSSESSSSIESSSSSSLPLSSSSSQRPALCGDGRCDVVEENPCLNQNCPQGFLCTACTVPEEYCASDCP